MYYFITSDIIGIRLAQQNDEIYQRADSAQTQREQPDKPGADLSLVEAVNAPAAKEEAQYHSDPLVLHSAHGNTGSGNVVIVIVVVIVDDDRLTGSSRAFQLLDLTSAVSADNCVLRNDLSAVLAELCSAAHRLHRLLILRLHLLRLNRLRNCVLLIIYRLLNRALIWLRVALLSGLRLRESGLLPAVVRRLRYSLLRRGSLLHNASLLNSSSRLIRVNLSGSGIAPALSIIGGGSVGFCKADS